MLTNAEMVDVPVLFSNWQYACFTYWRDYEYEARIKKAVIDFWNNHIVAGIPPEPSTPAELYEVYPKLESAKITHLTQAHYFYANLSVHS
jgi:predicted phage-related endonuclease